jgi:hypothetical protein
MSRGNYSKTVYPTEKVFAAACAAQRINGEYVKEDKNTYDVDGYIIGTEKVANRRLVLQYLLDEWKITDADREQGVLVREYCNALTFKMLQEKTLTDFEKVMLRLAQKESIVPGYETAVIGSLPASYERAVDRKTVESRIRNTAGYVGAVDEVVEVTAEVVKCYYTTNYNVFFVTAITTDNKAVMFSFRDKIESGTAVNIRGRVKAHRENGCTQLSRVRLKG